MTNGKYELVPFKGKISYANFVKFLDPFATKRKMIKAGNRPQQAEDGSPLPRNIKFSELDEYIYNNT